MRLGVWVLLLFLASFARGQEEPTFLVPPKRWAMVIGANAYPKFGNLSYASNDARAFKAFLESNLSYDPANISLLIDDADSKLTPTAENVTKELDRMLADPSLNKSDLFIFYFAGHGVGNEKADYLLPGDASPDNVEKVGLPVKEVIDRLAKAKLRNVLVIADACRSGSTNTFGKELLLLTRSTNICVMLGTQPGQRSHEYPQLQHGIFTYCLLKALKNADSYDKDTGALWASKIAEDTSKQVKDYTIRDYPTAPQVPSAWVEKTKDVLLKLDAANLSEADLLEHLPDLEANERDTYMLYLLARAEFLLEKKKYGEGLNILQAIDAINPNDERIGYSFAIAAIKLGRHGLADRIRTNVLSSKQQGRYADELALMPGTYEISGAEFRRAFENRWSESPWQTRFYRLLNAMIGASRLNLDYPKYLDTMDTLSIGDKRKTLAAQMLRAYYKRDYVEAANKAVEAAGAEGLEPERDILLLEANLCFMLAKDIPAAMRMMRTEAKNDQNLLLTLAFLANSLHDDQVVQEAMQRYLAVGLRAEDSIKVWQFVTPYADLYKLFKEKVKVLSSSDWRVRIVKGIFAYHDDHDPQKLQEAFSVVQEFREEYPSRMAAFLGGMANVADSFGIGSKEYFSSYQALYDMATMGLADVNGEPEFWSEFHHIAMVCGYLHTFGLRVGPFLLDKPKLKTFSIPLMTDIHRTLLQAGLDEVAAKFAASQPTIETKVLTLENEALELFSRNRDTEAQAKLAELAKLETASYSDAYSPRAALVEFYNAKAEKRPMEIKSSFAGPISQLWDIERQGGTLSDKEVDGLVSFLFPPACMTLYCRLFQVVDWSKLSRESRDKLSVLFMQVYKFLPSLPALEANPVVPGSKVADYETKVEGPAEIKLNATRVAGYVSVQVDPSGKVTGTFKFGADQENTISGTVDANGNLNAVVNAPPPLPTLHIYARLWPFKNPALYDRGSTKWITFFLYTDAGDSGVVSLFTPKK